MFSNDDQEQLSALLHKKSKADRLYNEILDWCKFIVETHGPRIMQEMFRNCDEGNPTVFITKIHSYEILHQHYKDEKNGLLMTTMDAIRVDPNISCIHLKETFFPVRTVRELLDIGTALPMLSAMLGSKMCVTSKKTINYEKSGMYGIIGDEENQLVYQYADIELYVTFKP